MPEKRAHSPEIDGETRSNHPRLEKPLLAPAVFEEFKWTCAAFRVQTDPNACPNTFPTLEPNPYDKHLAKPLQLLKLTLDFDKIEKFNELCFRSQHWHSVPSDAVQRLRGSVGYAVDTKPTNEDAVSRSAQRIIGDCLHLANLLLHGDKKAEYVAAVPESTFSIRTIETGVERQQRDHLTSLVGEKSFYLAASSKKETPAAGIAVSHRKGDEKVGTFMSCEFKDSATFAPRVILVFLLIVRAQVEDPQLDLPWPKPECNGCGQFKDCHEAWNLLQSGVSAPRDSTRSKLPPSPDEKAIDEFLLIWRDLIKELDLVMGANRVRRRIPVEADRLPLLEDIHNAVGQAYDNAFGSSEEAELVDEKSEVLGWLRARGLC